MHAAPATSKTRIVFLGALAFLWIGLLCSRLVELQLVRHSELARRARQQQQRTLEITPKRGVLYDREGRELAVSIGVDSVFAIPADVTDPRLAADLLAPVLGLEETLLADRLRSERSFVWLKRKLDAAQAERVRGLNLAGIYFQREYKRFYPKRQLAAHVLGFVGLDENGLAGVEYSLDKVIRGQPQRLLITADGRRRIIERHNQVPTEGASVVLTLDEGIQYLAEQELARALETTRAARGTIIVQETASGEILAMASHPAFNPNDPTAVPTSRHVNPAISLAYEPGSTFKVVTVAAALEEGLTWPGEVIDCQQGSILIAGHRIRDHKPFGLLNLREVIYESSDIGAIKIGLRLGNQAMYQHIRQWRFGEATGIELPAESRGLLRPAKNWSQISIGAISMGQEVAVTPLQLAAAISAIGNGGVWTQPRIVRKKIRPDGSEEHTRPATARIIPVEVAEELRRMLLGVVTQGTGRAAQPLGYTAAGKTGTAEKIDHTGTYSSTDFIASFAGFAPAHDPVVTVVVLLDSPRGRLFHGGEVAAPVFSKVVERTLAYLNISRDLPVLPHRVPPSVEKAAAGDLRPGRLAPRADAGGESGLPPAEAGQGAFVLTAERGASSDNVIVVQAKSVAVPDLTGLSIRDVTERLASVGLEPAFAGTGVAVEQRPAPGSRVPRGSRVWVEFRSSLPTVPARAM